MKTAGKYVTFFETMDPGLAERLVPGAPKQSEAKQTDDDAAWGGIWAEAALINDFNTANGGTNGPTGVGSKTVEDEIVVDGEHSPPKDQDPEQPPQDTYPNNVQPTPRGASDILMPSRHKPNPLEFLVGFAMTAAVILETIGIEIASLVVFFIALGFLRVGKYMDHSIFMVFSHLFYMIAYLLFVVDRLLLYISLMVAEILAYIAIIVVMIFAGPNGARLWHNHVRKIAHLTRWTMRQQDWGVDRSHPWESSSDFY